MPNNIGGTIARKCDAMTHELQHAAKPALNAASLALKRSIEASRDRVTSGGRLRNVGRKGAQLGIRYTITGVEHPVSLVTAVGPWPLIEGPTKAHDIAPRRRGGKKGVRTPYGPRRRVHVRGTRGKHPWATGSAVGLPLAQVELNSMVSAAVHRGFLS